MEDIKVNAVFSDSVIKDLMITYLILYNQNSGNWIMETNLEGNVLVLSNVFITTPRDPRYTDISFLKKYLSKEYYNIFTLNEKLREGLSNSILYKASISFLDTLAKKPHNPIKVKTEKDSKKIVPDSVYASLIENIKKDFVDKYKKRYIISDITHESISSSDSSSGVTIQFKGMVYHPNYFYRNFVMEQLPGADRIADIQVKEMYDTGNVIHGVAKNLKYIALSVTIPVKVMSWLRVEWQSFSFRHSRFPLAISAPLFKTRKFLTIFPMKKIRDYEKTPYAETLMQRLIIERDNIYAVRLCRTPIVDSKLRFVSYSLPIVGIEYAPSVFKMGTGPQK